MAKQHRQPARASGQAPGRQPHLSSERWEEILQAAAEEFYESGYSAARLQDIAKRVGLLTGSLYHYIQSKEELLFALVTSTVQLELATIAEDDELAGSAAPVRLRAFIHRQLQLLDKHRAWVRAVQRDLPFLEDGHRREIDTMTASLRSFVASIVQQGIADGDFDPAQPVDVAVNSVFTLFTSTPEWARSRGRWTLEEIGDWYTRLLLSGLAPQGASRRVELPTLSR